LIGLVEALAAFLVVGVLSGMAAGYFGGLVDRAIGRAADLFFAIPRTIIVLVVLAVFPHNQHAAMVTFGILGGALLSRVVPAAVAWARQQPFADAAAVAGLSSWRIMARHMLPRTLGPIIVQGSIYAGVALGLQAGLAFLALGPVPPAPSWGGLVADASN